MSENDVQKEIMEFLAQEQKQYNLQRESEILAFEEARDAFINYNKKHRSDAKILKDLIDLGLSKDLALKYIEREKESIALLTKKVTEIKLVNANLLSSKKMIEIEMQEKMSMEEFNDLVAHKKDISEKLKKVEKSKANYDEVLKLLIDVDEGVVEKNKLRKSINKLEKISSKDSQIISRLLKLSENKKDLIENSIDSAYENHTPGYQEDSPDFSEGVIRGISFGDDERSKRSKKSFKSKIFKMDPGLDLVLDETYIPSYENYETRVNKKDYVFNNEIHAELVENSNDLNVESDTLIQLNKFFMDPNVSKSLKSPLLNLNFNENLLNPELGKYEDKAGVAVFAKVKENRYSCYSLKPKAIRSMLLKQQDDNPGPIVITKGSEAFKRQVWLQGQILGITIEGYTPTNLDVLTLQTVQEELNKKNDISLAGALRNNKGAKKLLLSYNKIEDRPGEYKRVLDNLSQLEARDTEEMAQKKDQARNDKYEQQEAERETIMADAKKAMAQKRFEQAKPVQSPDEFPYSEEENKEDIISSSENANM